MPGPLLNALFARIAHPPRVGILAFIVLCSAPYGITQDAPLLSGGIAFQTSTNGGNTSYFPIVEPLLAAPIGNHFLVESRAALLETFAPNTNGQAGYSHSHFVGLSYLQGDYLASRHLTVVGGSFLIPFATYNERLSPIWIGNFQDAPLSTALGLMSTSVGLGAMTRGSVISRPRYAVDYTGYFSARSGNEQFNSDRSAGARGNLYLPNQRLEVGFSYGRLLQGTHENFYGTHVWWEPKDESLRFRSEFARGQHAQGYWVEADYRTQAFGGLNSWVGRIEPLFRIQQTFRRDTIATDGLPSENTQRADFGLDYNLPHNTRILTSYARQFSATNTQNVWETEIVYRFLFPAWKGKSK